MENQELYSYKEMQELLPDYVFKRVSLEEKALFERTLPNYPELQDEVKEVRSVFGKIEDMPLEEEISRRTRNLSVRVKNKMRKAPKWNYPFIIRYVIPPAGLVIVVSLLTIFNPIKDSQHIAQTPAATVQEQDGEIFTNSDLTLLMDNTQDEEDLENVKLDMAYGVDLQDMEDINLTELFEDELQLGSAANFEKDLNSIEISESDYFYELLENLNDIDEDEFSEIIKDLENAEIFS